MASSSEQEENHINGDSLASLENQKVLLRTNKTNANDFQTNDREILRRRSGSVLEIKEHANCRLKEELLKALQDLKLKDEECKKLNEVQVAMNEELEELTASLFEEANKMVQDANIKRMNQEKLLKEATAKVEVLEAEVTALKSLVITSTPAMPNYHLHPQLDTVQQAEKPKKTSFIKGHRRSTSHHNISREIKLSELKPAPVQTVSASMVQQIQQQQQLLQKEQLERGRQLDPSYFEEFKQWKNVSPKLDLEHCFLKRIDTEEIQPCLSFIHKQFATSAFDAIMKNTLTIDPVSKGNPSPSRCALTGTHGDCNFKIKLKDNDEGHFICQLARNRITAICDLITYLRYICQGIVKSEEKDIYWEIMRLRKQICLARLGLT